MKATLEEAELWHAERRKGFGGSDILEVLADEETGGCQRRIYYDKAGFEPDRPQDPIPVMQRGKALEQAAADLYETVTGRDVLPTGALVDQDRPWNRVNADRIISVVPEHQGTGILEIKTMNQWVFRRAKREGMKSRHILQLQHGIGVTDRKWGAFMVLQPDTWEHFEFDMERDDELIQIIRDHTAPLWEAISTGGAMPERVDPSDHRCKGCRFADQCQGAANVFMYGLDQTERAKVLPQAPEFADWLEAYDEAHGERSAAEKVLAELKTRVAEMLGDRSAVECGKRRIYLTQQERRTIDTKKLRQAYPDVAAECEKVGTSTTLRVY